MPHKWGIKAWVLTDSSHGYIWAWKLYTGKEEGKSSDLGLSHRVILDLTSDERLHRTLAYSTLDTVVFAGTSCPLFLFVQANLLVYPLHIHVLCNYCIMTDYTPRRLFISTYF